MTSPPRSLYISYFSLSEPLVQTQVLPYLRQLVAGGYDMSLLTFEAEGRRKLPADQAAEAERLAEQGITWRALNLHSRPFAPAKAYDILHGAWAVRRWMRQTPFDILHGRSHLATAIANLARQGTGARVLFDIRGLMADEYVDAGRWREEQLPYRITKLMERQLLRQSDGFVVLTERCREHLLAGDERPIEVIPCCTDQRFSTDPRERALALRREHAIAERAIIYAGSVEGGYQPEALADLLALASRTRGLMPVVLTHGDPSILIQRWAASGLAPTDYRIIRAAPADVPAFLSMADVAVNFMAPKFSRIAASPTKVPEYLAAGLPVISSAGIGDIDAHLAGCAAFVTDYSDAGYEKALDEALRLRADPKTAERCRRTAATYYDIETVGGPRYRRLYERLLTGDGLRQAGVAA